MSSAQELEPEPRIFHGIVVKTKARTYQARMEWTVHPEDHRAIATQWGFPRHTVAEARADLAPMLAHAEGTPFATQAF